jgi:hypothetical protein
LNLYIETELAKVNENEVINKKRAMKTRNCYIKMLPSSGCRVQTCLDPSTSQLFKVCVLKRIFSA